jgi:hypothetical protein
MQAADAIVITLPGVPDTTLFELEAKFGQVNGIAAAFAMDDRGPEAADPGMFLKVAPDGPGERPRLLAALSNTIDLLRSRGISGAIIKLPDGIVIELSGSGPDGDRDVRPTDDPERIDFRLGFAVDVATYSTRPMPAQREVQQRLATLVREVVADAQADPRRTDSQESGDGIIVFFPAGMQFQRVLPRLLRATAHCLDTDNRRHTDRLRLRMSTTIGPVGKGAMGYAGSTVVELSRLVDSDTLRQALDDDPRVGLVVLVSDALYGHVVGAGHPGLVASEFRRLEVAVKRSQAVAWLWTV